MSRPGFLFIRHGETEWNREGRLQGQRDIPLNGRGRSQADEAGRRTAALLRSAGVEPGEARFVVSPLGRARETAERMRVAMALPAAGYDLDDRLTELSFGAWEGFTWPELKGREPIRVRVRKADKWHFVPPGGESYADLAERVRPWLDTVTERLVVVAHGGVARALMVLAGGVSQIAAPDTDVLQGQVLVFADGGTRWR